MGKLAGGLANDLASTLLLATDKRVLMAPAMNVRMWHHAATQRNLATLWADGVLVVGPDVGAMACGEFGLGRMAEPPASHDAIDAALGGGALAGRHVLVTSGPTFEPIDPVRYLANRSSGRQGYAIASAAARLGADTVLVSGPVELQAPPGVRLVPVESAREMLDAVTAELPASIAVFTAAVADWRVEAARGKIKKRGAPPALELTENPDSLKTVAAGPHRPDIVVGFAAETENIVEHAKAKLAGKSCDLIVANDVSSATKIMGGTHNTVHLVTRDGVESWPEMSKQEVATRLMERLASMAASLRKAAE
jgi:phosphopantothenoylcysteine decarboxylase/phosphopantothenate--cysteine ligase